MTNSPVIDPIRIVNARYQYRRFIDKCSASNGLFRLTPNADSSSYALCFAIFGYRLLCAQDVIDENQLAWDRCLRSELEVQRHARQRYGPLSRDKPYLQLLTFTLSALSILGTLHLEPLDEEVCILLPDNIKSALTDARALNGDPRSGNQAMFIAVLLIYARDYLKLDTQPDLDMWVALHQKSINRFGFWGNSRTPSYLQFQNGYHQYEIFQYLEPADIPWEIASATVASLADRDGHFAPYPGGGGCYDYDAVFILTTKYQISLRYRSLLERTFNSILLDQNPDGGFCESRYIRPRSFENLSRGANHALSCHGIARLERFRSVLTLLRPKHDRIHTHWSIYSREWGESDLWDSWFRMLTLARIDCALNPDKLKHWGFIDFPGIGFHSGLSKNGAK